MTPDTTPKSQGNDWLIYGLGGALLVFTGFRAFHLLTMTLPPGAGAVALFALLALDGGVIAWSTYFQHHAQSKGQIRISVGMTGACLAGVCLTVFGDTAYTLNQATMTDVTWWAIIAQAVIVCLNVVACVVVPMLSPAAQKEREHRAVMQSIEAASLEAIRSRSQELASELANIRANHWLNQQRANYRPFVQEVSQPLALPNQPLQEPKKPANRPAAGAGAADSGGTLEDIGGGVNFTKRGQPQ